MQAARVFNLWRIPTSTVSVWRAMIYIYTNHLSYSQIGENEDDDKFKTILNYTFIDFVNEDGLLISL